MFGSTFLFFGTVAAYDRLADAGALDRFLARELKLSPDAFAELTTFVRAPASYGWPCLVAHVPRLSGHLRPRRRVVPAHEGG